MSLSHEAYLQVVNPRQFENTDYNCCSICYLEYEVDERTEGFSYQNADYHDRTTLEEALLAHCSETTAADDTQEDLSFPVALTCGHHFCYSCIQRWCAEKNDAVIPCPCCRRRPLNHRVWNLQSRFSKMEGGGNLMDLLPAAVKAIEADRAANTTTTAPPAWRGFVPLRSRHAATALPTTEQVGRTSNTPTAAPSTPLQPAAQRVRTGFVPLQSRHATPAQPAARPVRRVFRPLQSRHAN
ncbi:hypothetical protein K490DRAFT_66849 [Saccharata proteae CBS 121410]|uniref:RING-type domain-containing protein n=1 Tax=Saccharata proteae CBS 121410 TaxID=1314787 RepID=A0A9P4LXP6_9PEZI|nr:hypothetical protein K490DRAFT_66849 [Saccharata proteae CBS 121410]